MKKQLIFLICLVLVSIVANGCVSEEVSLENNEIEAKNACEVACGLNGGVFGVKEYESELVDCLCNDGVMHKDIAIVNG